MIVAFLLFVIAILLVSVFWELSKINSRLKTLLTHKQQDYGWAKNDAAHQEAPIPQKP
jgi:high-affinity Fe2+/Pb2+ permease